MWGDTPGREERVWGDTPGREEEDMEPCAFPLHHLFGAVASVNPGILICVNHFISCISEVRTGALRCYSRLSPGNR